MTFFFPVYLEIAKTLMKMLLSSEISLAMFLEDFVLNRGKLITLFMGQEKHFFLHLRYEIQESNAKSFRIKKESKSSIGHL